MDEAGRFAVLFVDDEPLVLEGLRRMLRAESRGWRFGFASGAAAALALLAEEPVDAVVTDLRMPDMDGVALLERVQALQPAAARIILSGEVDSGRTLPAVAAAHQFLPKPCPAEVLRTVLGRISRLRGLLGGGRLIERLAAVRALPSLPAIYAAILAEIGSPNASIRAVGRLVARDIGLSAKVLQVVNSAFFGLPRRVASAEEGVGLLGLASLRTLVLAAGVFAQAAPRRLPGLDLPALWEHSFMTGVAARAIAAVARPGRPSEEEAAFTAGVLHDLGKLVLAPSFPQTYAAAAAEPERGVDFERAACGASHAEAGACLLGLWGLEEEVVAAIAGHHRRFEGAEAEIAPAFRLAAADRLAHRLTAERPGSVAPAAEKDGGCEEGCEGPALPQDWVAACRAAFAREWSRAA